MLGQRTGKIGAAGRYHASVSSSAAPIPVSSSTSPESCGTAYA